MPTIEFIAHDVEDTDRFAAVVAAVLPPGSVVALNGTLGAGKTRFVQGFCAALGVPREAVVSPTFVLVHEYPGEPPVYHFDAYRITDDDEFLQLGPEEYFESEGYSLVEWADRVARCLPEDYLQIDIEPQGPTARRFVVSAHGERLREAVERLAARL